MSSLSFKLAAAGSLALLLASCSSSRAPQPVAPVGQPGGAISGPSEFNRPHKDGAPWWDVDVSRIPDATPMPHYGRVKASPYTVFGKQYYPIQDARRYKAIGPASWYGTKFHGQATANGETYDLYGMTAAHKTLPLPSYVRVTNLDNGKSAILRVNDRGPFYSDRIIDLSFAAAKKLGYAESGTARVVGPAGPAGAHGPGSAAAGGAGQDRGPAGGAAPRAVHAAPASACRGRGASADRRKKKRFSRSLWPVSPGSSLRQSGRCGAAQGETERGRGCPGVHQLSDAQPADSPPRKAGAAEQSGRG